MAVEHDECCILRDFLLEQGVSRVLRPQVMTGFIIGLVVGLVVGPIALVVVLFLLRDVTPPILFTPSDWDK
jgi:hypothetical protein